MPLQLPNLDDRRFADLVEEARSLIPAWAPDWTNHNPSDPGITLIELFAYLAEVLLYRLNRVTDDQRRKFLKLLNGPGWLESGDLREDVRQTVLALRARYRAVTASDYELLATEDFNAWLESQRAAEAAGEPLDPWWQLTGLDRADPLNMPSKMQKIRRAQCVPQRNLAAGSESARREPCVGHVSVVVLPQTGYAGTVPLAQLRAVWGFLDERRTLATRHHVVAPFFVPVRPEIIVVNRAGVPADALLSRIAPRIAQFLDPVDRGNGEPGWPFGRDVYVSELMALLERIDGVDYVVDLMLYSTVSAGEPVSRVAGEPIWHADGELIGIALQPQHLPEARWSADPADQIVIVPANRVVPVRFAIRVVAGAGVEAAGVRRDIKLAVRTHLHPLHGGPGPDSGQVAVLLAQIRSAVASLSGVSSVVSLTVEIDASRLQFGGSQVQGFVIQAGEVVDPRFDIDVAAAP